MLASAGGRVSPRWLAPLLAVGVASSVSAPVRAQVDGQAVYERWCAGCHGVDGRGTGPAAHTMLPRPRDFTLALYQVRTTATGQLPTDADLLKVVNEGMPGTAMPGWADALTEAERRAVVEHLKTFSRFFEDEAPEALDFGRPTRGSEEAIARGRAVFDDVECWRCHGQQGRGDGASAPTLEDDTGFPIYAADLTANWRFNGGGSVEEIYRVLRTGLDGTPMPTFYDIVEAGVITNDDLWSLAHYVRSLSPRTPPEVREVVTAGLVSEAAVPQTVTDPAWEDAERFYVPLVGQIVLAPRWFGPRVSGVWVQALHDGQDLALLVSWTDPSESPDPDWSEFAQRVIETMAPGDEGGATAPGAPDQLVVQFPSQLADGMERPYFLQGDARRPASTWTWRSGEQGAFEGVARGMGTGVRQAPEQQQLRAVAQHQDGEWKVLFIRALSTGDEDDLTIPVGRAVPMAFQAWDGDNGESGRQGAVSTWYFLFLQRPNPTAVYVAPPITLAFTLMLGLLIVRKAQRDATGGRPGVQGIGPSPASALSRQQLFGFGVGVTWLAFALGALRTSSTGWAAGHADLGFWWSIIAGLLAIAGVSALIGTWIHTHGRNEVGRQHE